MPFEKIEDALSICEEHLAGAPDENSSRPQVESYLLAGVVLLIVSEYEELLESIFSERALQCNDEQVANYIKGTISRTFRSPDVSKITDTLKRFDGNYKRRFVREVENTELHAAWDNLMKARHFFVHKKGALNLTLRELRETYPKTKAMFEKVRSSLCLAQIKSAAVNT